MTRDEKLAKYKIDTHRHVYDRINDTDLQTAKSLIKALERFLTTNNLDDVNLDVDIDGNDWCFNGIFLRATRYKTEEELDQDIKTHEIAIEEQKQRVKERRVQLKLEEEANYNRLRIKMWREASIPAIAKSLVVIHGFAEEVAVEIAFWKKNGKLMKRGYDSYLSKFPTVTHLPDITTDEAQNLKTEYENFKGNNS